MTLILASSSPRRKALLTQAGIEFRATDPAVDEWAPACGNPHRVALENAEAKARAVPGDWVLGADTIVAVGDRLLGKATDEDEARAILLALSGTTHRVVTGVALRAKGSLFLRSVETRVTMRVWSDAEFDAYIESSEWRGKAGAYAIQESADRFVTHVEGPYDNVVGLPVDAVRALLTEATR